MTGLAVLAAAGAGGWIGAGSREEANAHFVAARPDRLALVMPAPPAPLELQADLSALAAAYREPVGVAVVDVTEGWAADVDGDGAYPQQSVSKLWVALSVLEAVDRGELSLDQAVVMRPEDRSVFYQPVSSRIGETGFETTLRDLMRRAISESDNAANDKLMREVGGAGPVSDILAAKGLDGIAVGAYERDLQSKIAGLAWIPEYGYGWNFKAARAELPQAVRDVAETEYLAAPPDGATPLAVARGLAALSRGELLSPSSTEVLLNLMAEARTGPNRLKGGLPPGWRIAHKTGTGPDWRHGSVGINDVGLLTAPDGRVYAVAVMMRRTRAPVPERLAFMQSVTRAVAAHWQASRQLGEGQVFVAAETPVGVGV